MACFSEIPLSYDAAILLDCGRLILLGAVPYVDYVEMNLPITHYVYLVPVALAEILGTDLASTFQGFVLVVVSYSIWALAVLCGRLPFSFPLTARLFAAAGWLAFSVFAVPIGGFGQREHLFMLTYTPWLICRQIRHSGASIPFEYSLLTGLVLGPSLLMKPHFVAIAALIETWQLVRSRRFRALMGLEVQVVLGWVLIYAGHFLFVPSAMAEEFFSRWMPFVAEHYGAYNCSFSELLSAGFPKNFCIPSMPVLGLGLIFLSRKISHRALARHVELCGLGTLLGFACFLALHKGWNYQLVPAYAFLALALVCLPEIVEGWVAMRKTALGLPSSMVATFLVAGACVTMVSADILFTRQGLRNGQVVRPSVDAWIGFVREQSHLRERITFISTGTTPAYPTLVYTGRLPGSRYLQAFPIAMLYQGIRPTKADEPVYRNESQWTPDERRFLEELGDDVAFRRPGLIAISDTSPCQGCPPGFRINEYLDVIGWKTRYLSDYHFVTTFRDFAIYKRNAALP